MVYLDIYDDTIVNNNYNFELNEANIILLTNTYSNNSLCQNISIVNN